MPDTTMQPPAADPMMEQPGGMPANPSVDQAVDDLGSALEERRAAIAAQNPKPTQAILYTEVQALVKALNEAVGFLSDGTAPPVAYKPPTIQGGTKEPLPADVYVLLVALAGAIMAAADGNPDLMALSFDPSVEVTTRPGVQALTQKLMQAARSEPLKAAMMALSQPAPSGEVASAPPSTTMM